MDDDRKLRSYRKYRRILERLSFISILWPPLLTKSITYRICSYLNIAICVKACMFIFHFCVTYITKIPIFVTGASVLLSFTTNIFRAWGYLVHTQEIIEMKKILDDMFEEEIQDEQMRSLFLSNLGQFNYICYTISVSVIGTGSMFCILPMTNMMTQLFKHVEKKRYLLPYPAKIPYSVEDNMALYVLQFTFDAIMAVILTFITSSVDGFFGYFTFHIVGQLKVLCHKIRNLDCSDIEEYRSNLKKYVERYLILLKCQHTVQRVYSPILVIVISTTAIILCTVVFQAVETELTTLKVIMLTFYTCFKISQAYAYTLYGSLLISQNEEFYESIYFSDWASNVNRAFVHDFLIILSQQPNKIVVCNFLPITVDVFKSILNTSISYFFLLQTVNAPD